ncbi:hypothetical protein [Apibacter sp. HY039]|uniref:hypothetical protein n=1 Tax=Apibacter sp. HY039 TaxID=2501476 RepID=UPI000FEC0069|nr:hypothetical protein [Apibacter sp. HY039]
MNIIKYLIFLGIISFAYGQEKAYRKIFWSEENSLSWKNFKGKSQNSNNKIAALSFCGIQYNSCILQGNVYKYKVKAFFVPQLSWVRVKNEHILKHEQLHFDIAEIFSRKLRKAFSENPVEPKDSQVEIYQPLFKEYMKMQELYDNETHHGILEDINKEWENKIHNELNQLIDYKKEEICY